jgi:predicted phage-related endonuclease
MKTSNACRRQSHRTTSTLVIMDTLNVIQGTPEWIAARRSYDCASEAAAALGYDKNTSRDELLRLKATGGEREFSDWVRKNLLEKGHYIEALARPFAEAITGDLYPQVGVLVVDGLRLLASFDGLTLDDSVAWECKSHNANLLAAMDGSDLPDSHWPQVEQQLLISGADHVLFTVSDGTEDGSVHMEYRSKPERRTKLLAGWAQFNTDLAEYIRTDAASIPIAATIKDLPAAEKMNYRNEIIADAKRKWTEYVAGLNAQLGIHSMPAIEVNFIAALKGLKSPESMSNAVNTELARAKIAAKAIAEKIQAASSGSETPSIPTLSMGEICKRIDPLSITVAGLSKLGFEPAGKDRSKTLYHESDWPNICAALSKHIEEARTPFQPQHKDHS